MMSHAVDEYHFFIVRKMVKYLTNYIKPKVTMCNIPVCVLNDSEILVLCQYLYDFDCI